MANIRQLGVRRTGLFVCLLATLGVSGAESVTFGQSAAEHAPVRRLEVLPQDKNPGSKEKNDPQAQPAAPGGALQPPAPAPAGPAKARRAAKKSPKKVAWLEIDGVLRDSPPPFRLIPTDEGPRSMRRIVDRLTDISHDKSVAGTVIYLNQPDLTMAQVDELGRAITAFRTSGKRVIVFAEAYDLHTYLLATYADRITVLKNGEIGISGLSMEEMYLAGLFEKVGAKADYIQIGKFKGAQEPMTRTGPTAEWSKTIDGVLDDMYAQFVQRVASSRKKKPEEVEKFFGECWKMSADDYAKEKWVDAVVDRGMVEETETVFGTDFEYFDLLEKKSAQQPESPFALMQMLTQPVPKTVARNSIAVINAQGAIGSGRSQSKFNTGLLFDEPAIGSQSLEEALTDARNEPMIVGVVIRINSPGGSALASEVIWQAVREVQENKPVFISVNGMAASGGYYIACAGEKIYVLPSSIVGSIGVVGGKVTFGGLYEKLGVGIYRRSRGPNADIFNSVTGFTPEQADMLKAAMQRTYTLFTERVKAGRGNKIANIEDVAQGRVFSGKQAVENGLADKVGGLSTAVDDMAKQLSLATGSYDVIQWPRPATLAEFLDQMMHGLAAADMPPQDQATAKAPVMLLRTLIGERNWRSVAPVATGMMLMSDEHVLTLLPVAITVK